VVVLFFISFGSAYSDEPIPITLSHTMENVTFDGKWTFETEWKASSLNTYSYENGTQIVLRSAHQGDFVYILVNPIDDHAPDRLEDYAIVCFDAGNNKTITAQQDDYCFMAVLEGESTVYRGGSIMETGFEQIPHPEGFTAASSISDHNDRYTPIPHPSYEFKIPTNLIGRDNIYGFFLLVHDANLQKTYTYPGNVDPAGFASDPSMWGEIYSPDKSLPEFGFAEAALVASFALVASLARLKRRLMH